MTPLTGALVIIFYQVLQTLKYIVPLWIQMELYSMAHKKGWSFIPIGNPITKKNFHIASLFCSLIKKAIYGWAPGTIALTVFTIPIQKINLIILNWRRIG